MGGTARHRLIAALAALAAACAIAETTVAAASGQGRASRPRAGHIGVVVTAGEVFVSWGKPAGSASATVVVRRSESTCPRSPDQGSGAGEVSPRHVIDRSVTAGKSYCYAIFVTSPAGVVTTIGNTGLLTVPDARTVPPAHATAPAPAPSVTVSRVDPALARRIEIVAGAALAAALVVLTAVLAARRVSNGRMVLRPTMRESLVSRNSSALVVPAMIAIGWVGIVIAFVVLR
jgi:hypothetical protein